MVATVTSPHGGEIAARQALNDRFADRVSFDPEFTRRTVSYQANREVPGLRWMKYKEANAAPRQPHPTQAAPREIR